MEAYGEQSYYSREEDNDSITSRDRCSHGVLQGLSTRGHSSSTTRGCAPPLTKQREGSSTTVKQEGRCQPA